MRKIILSILLYVPLVLFGQNYALQIYNGANITMTGNVSITIDQPSNLGIYKPDPTIGGIYSDNEVSKIIWNVKNSSGIYIIPYENIAGVQIPMIININSSGVQNASNSYIITSTWHTNNSNIPYPQFVLPNSVNNAVDIFWLLDFGGFSLNPSTTLALTYVDPDELDGLSEADLTAQNYNYLSNIWELPSTGVDNVNLNNVNNITGVNRDAPWVLVSKYDPLPVEMLSFTYKCGELRWSTASETNCDYFAILYSINNENWNILSRINGSGNLNSLMIWILFKMELL